MLGTPLDNKWNASKHAHNRVKAAKALGTPSEKTWNKAEHAQGKVKATEVLDTSKNLK